MARIVFLQLNEYELHGPQSIAAVLASGGHESRLVVPGFEKDALAAVAEFKPDLVGIGHTTVERAEALAWARAIKDRLGVKVVLGGIDPTFHPDLAADGAVDAVVMGEAELTMLELMDFIEAGEDISEIHGLAARVGGALVKNPMRPLIEDLDELPFPAKSLYLGRYGYFKSYPIKFFMASRGCPHGCTYCANKGLRALYPNPEKYVRFKSPEYLIGEIKSVLDRYPARTVGFNDDLFTHRLSWLEEFLPRFKQEVGLPYFCCSRIDAMTEEKAKLLAETGCYTTWYGLESADPATRELVLGRRMTNENIKRGTEILHRHGILTQSYNMMNIPGETFEQGFETLRFNTEVGNDFVVASLFQPFPGTELVQKLVDDGRIEDIDMLSSRDKLSYFAWSPYEQEDTKKLTNLQKLFIVGNWFPGLLPAVKKLCSLPPNPLFDILFLGSFAVDYARSHRLKAHEVFRYNLRHLWTTYLKNSRLKPPETGGRPEVAE